MTILQGRRRMAAAGGGGGAGSHGRRNGLLHCYDVTSSCLDLKKRRGTMHDSRDWRIEYRWRHANKYGSHNRPTVGFQVSLPHTGGIHRFYAPYGKDKRMHLITSFMDKLDTRINWALVESTKVLYVTNQMARVPPCRRSKQCPICGGTNSTCVQILHPVAWMQGKRISPMNSSRAKRIK